MKLTVLCTALIVALSIGTITPVHAEDGGAAVSAADVEAALSGASSELIEEAVETAATVSSAATVEGTGTTMSIPRDPLEPVEVTMPGASVAISLPDAQSASSAVALDSGLIVYPSDSGAATTVVPLEEGVQMLSTIADAAAPTRFSYGVDLPRGGSIALVEDGSAAIFDEDGRLLITTTVPWALDARGTAVPTHYEVEQDRLIQVVEHTAGEYSYPIVADPTWGWRNAAWGLTLSRAETASIKDYAAAAGMCATIAKRAAGFAVACGVWASYLQVQAATANRQSPKGCLHVVVAPLPGAISHTRC